MFGELQIPRCVDAQREGATIEFLPTDQRLQLPASDVSYLRQEWDQLLGIDQAFGRVREVIETNSGLSRNQHHDEQWLPSRDEGILALAEHD